jgi:hypothetical protein
MKEIKKLFGNDFNIRLSSKFVANELLKGNKGIVWSNFHLKLISLFKSIRIDYLLKKVSNDKPGIVNKYFTPTFYVILTRKI